MAAGTPSRNRLARRAAAAGGAELMDADRDGGLRGAEVGGLLGGGVDSGGRGGGQRAFDRGAVEDVDLVALLRLAEGDIETVPGVAAAAGAPDPREVEVACGAHGAHVDWREKLQAGAGEGVGELDVGGRAEVTAGGTAAPGEGEAQLV